MSNRIVVRSDEDQHIVFSLYKAFYQEAVLDKPNQGHKHTELEISYILSGNGIYKCSGTAYEFKPGDIFFHCGKEQHFFEAINAGNAHPSMLVIRFDPRLIWSPSGQWFGKEYIRLFSSSNRISRLIPGDSPEAEQIRGLLDEMFCECHDHAPSYELLVKAKLMTVLALMVRHFDKELQCMGNKGAELQCLEQMEHSMQYILSHLGDPLSLDLLAKESCLSRSYYSAMFKTLNGVSVWDYVISQRIALAQLKLETSSDSIVCISEDCGFTNIASFNRAFKRITGKTPRDYRNSCRTGMPTAN